MVFAGLVFAAKIGDATRWLEGLAAFGVYSLASSAAYLLNDIRDVAHDREHPVKKWRPIATGELSTRTAGSLAILLALAAFALAGVLGPWSVLFLAGFAALQAGYSLGLKHVVLVRRDGDRRPVRHSRRRRSGGG